MNGKLIGQQKAMILVAALLMSFVASASGLNPDGIELYSLGPSTSGPFTSHYCACLRVRIANPPRDLDEDVTVNIIYPSSNQQLGNMENFQTKLVKGVETYIISTQTLTYGVNGMVTVELKRGDQTYKKTIEIKPCGGGSWPPSTNTNMAKDDELIGNVRVGFTATVQSGSQTVSGTKEVSVDSCPANVKLEGILTFDPKDRGKTLYYEFTYNNLTPKSRLLKPFALRLVPNNRPLPGAPSPAAPSMTLPIQTTNWVLERGSGLLPQVRTGWIAVQQVVRNRDGTTFRPAGELGRIVIRCGRIKRPDPRSDSQPVEQPANSKKTAKPPTE